MKTEMKRNLEQYVHHKVVDQNGDKIGTLQCLWSDQESEPVYLGVQTGWLFGKTHIVPAERVEVNESARTIRLPYTVQKIKDAPSFDSKCEMDPNTEREVRSYYNISPAGSTRQAAGRSPDARTLARRRACASIRSSAVRECTNGEPAERLAERAAATLS